MILKPIYKILAHFLPNRYLKVRGLLTKSEYISHTKVSDNLDARILYG